jgi:restriction endonuclease Mrr
VYSQHIYRSEGADTGIDGYIYFFDDNTGNAKKIVVQVKSGHVNAGQIRDLKGVIDREKAVVGVFITLQETTQPMRQEALSAGFYEPEFFSGQHFPKIQILTVRELLAGKEVQYRRGSTPATFKKAEKKSKVKEKQGVLGL